MPAGWYPDPSHPAFLRYWDGTQWTSAVVPRPQSARRRPFLALGSVVIVLGVLQVIGSLLPWATALAGLVKRSGVDGGSDGWITLVAGGLAVIWGIRLVVDSEQRWMGVALAAISAVSSLVAIADLSDISSTAGISAGSGLVMAMSTSIATVVTGLIRACTRTPMPSFVTPDQGA